MMMSVQANAPRILRGNFKGEFIHVRYVSGALCSTGAGPHVRSASNKRISGATHRKARHILETWLEV